MNKLALTILFLMLSCVTTKTAKEPVNEDFPVTLNTIQLIGNVNEVSAGYALEILERLPKGTKVDIYIQALYGDGRFALKLIRAMKKHETRCFARFAAGPSFSVFQACDKRLVMEHSILIPTPPQAVVQGAVTAEQLAEVSKELEFFKENLTALEAKRMGRDLDEYYKYLQSGDLKTLQIEGSKAFAANASDGYGNLSCPRLTQNYMTLPMTDPTGQVFEIEMTVCPLPRTIAASVNDPAFLFQVFMTFGLIVDMVELSEGPDHI